MFTADSTAAVTVRSGLLLLLLPTSSFAFPPYRSTDAASAEPWILETRLGVLRIRHDHGDTAYFTPLLRMNLGLPGAVEIVSELEHRADGADGLDAAVGVKWAPIQRCIDVGVETLALLPVADGQSDAGVESQLLVTYRHERWRVHINAGGVYDARPPDTESGWRASGLLEFVSGRWRPGAELFVKDVGGDEPELLAGIGLIVTSGRFDIRTGLHAGLTETSPDLSASLWVATSFDLH